MNNREMFLDKVVKVLVQFHQKDRGKAVRMISEYGLPSLLDKTPEGVMGVNASIWADWIVKKKRFYRASREDTC